MAIRFFTIERNQNVCDYCGKAGIWRSRAMGFCCVLGEVTCDACEHKIYHAEGIAAQEEPLTRASEASANWASLLAIF